MVNQSSFTAVEKKASMSLSLIYGTRMFGLFLIFPVFAIYAKDMAGASPLLIGFALGVYGLSQSILQIPFGVLSDKLGRKVMISVGLVLFIIGSIICALADNIYWIIIGRAVQGSGAVAAVIMALAADLTAEHNRTKIMAFIGISIGISFVLSLIAGSFLAPIIGGLAGLFYLTAILALIGLIILWWVVPNPKKSSFHRDAQPVASQLWQMFNHPQLSLLNVSIFLLHMTLSSLFLIVPHLMMQAGLLQNDFWQVYAVVMVLAIIFMMPLIIIAEKYGKMKLVFMVSIALLGMAVYILQLSFAQIIIVYVALSLYFTGFNAIESILPSLVSRIAPSDKKGSAMGIYTTFQFLGSFAGGGFGGFLLGLGDFYLFSFLMLITTLWVLLLGFYMQHPKMISSALFKIKSKARKGDILKFTGVVEATINRSEKIAYLKVDNKTFKRQDFIDKFV
ncbi:MAG: MFS transporter [Gammaproteobacteria bacterium]|nr:MAG: MFS transporter [Gammaproteobacteria bacterium]